ncbi:MAG: response regulator [Clostridia bacterium]|nr:response regulator [Clostridia bacterium]
MYRALIVDDEPTAIDFLQTLIDRKAPDFQVVGKAGNGQECLSQITETKPDIIISDIRMPVMDGIELIKQINSDYPKILTLLVSGYEEFEYARQALKYNAVDYIKKPVVPRVFSEVMAKMKEQLDVVFFEERNRTIRNLTKGIVADPGLLNKYFPEEAYYGILVRKNGLPRRFLATQENEIFSEVYESIIVYGRDEMESLYLITEEMLPGHGQQALLQYIKGLLVKENKDAFFTTVIAAQEPIRKEDFSSKIKELYRVLDTKTIIGRSQILFIEDCSVSSVISENTNTLQINTQMIKKLAHCLSLQQYDRVRQELKKIFDICQKEARTQLQVEELVQQVLFLLRNYGVAPDYGSGIEYDIEDAFYHAADMGMLSESIDALFFEDKEAIITANSKIDTPEYFNLIKNYIISNMEKPLTLQLVSKELGISQTYLSKMFRKYENKSFNNFLTQIRMEEAKRLIKSDKDLYIKDIAALVGYPDQFYFSRLFRSYTGVCPSDYSE